MEALLDGSRPRAELLLPLVGLRELEVRVRHEAGACEGKGNAVLTEPIADSAPLLLLRLINVVVEAILRDNHSVVLLGVLDAVAVIVILRLSVEIQRGGCGRQYPRWCQHELSFVNVMA